MDIICGKAWSKGLIPVALRPEPADFEKRVRKPGQRWLAANPNPRAKDMPRHWKNAVQNVYEAYERICAYTCMYLASVHETSIDHFQPRAVRPDLAYEWSNFRLALPRINVHKGDSQDVTDPFEVKLGWFAIEFPSCLIRPGGGLCHAIAQKVSATIDALKLNSDDKFVQDRCDTMVLLAKDEVTLTFMERRYPFLAYEVKRQGLQGQLNQVFKSMS